MILNERVFASFNDAFIQIINEIWLTGNHVAGVSDPKSIGSNFGTSTRDTKELIAYTFAVTSPRARLLNVEGRKINKQYALATFLWSLTGSRNGSYILQFNQSGSQFKGDNDNFYSAIGPHIFRRIHNKYEIIESIIELLRSDPTTRRAVVQFYSNSAIHAKVKDVPCYNHLQFFIREDTLICHVVMRSQNALKILPYDFFLFSLIHEAIAVRLGISLGVIYFTCNSIHIYEDEMKYHPSSFTIKETIEYPEMVNFDDSTITYLISVFKSISNSLKFKKDIHINMHLDKLNLDEYWKTLIKNHFIYKY